MKRILTTTLCILLTVTAICQKKDSTQKQLPIPDSVEIISLSDLNSTLISLSDKVTYTDYIKFQNIFQLLYQNAIQRRSKPKKIQK